MVWSVCDRGQSVGVNQFCSFFLSLPALQQVAKPVLYSRNEETGEKSFSSTIEKVTGFLLVVVVEVRNWDQKTDWKDREGDSQSLEKERKNGNKANKWMMWMICTYGCDILLIKLGFSSFSFFLFVCLCDKCSTGTNSSSGSSSLWRQELLSHCVEQKQQQPWHSSSFDYSFLARFQQPNFSKTDCTISNSSRIGWF